MSFLDKVFFMVLIFLGVVVPGVDVWFEHTLHVIPGIFGGGCLVLAGVFVDTKKVKDFALLVLPIIPGAKNVRDSSDTDPKV